MRPIYVATAVAKGNDKHPLWPPQPKRKKVRPTFTMANELVGYAKSQLARIQHDDPNWLPALYELRRWINNFIKKGENRMPSQTDLLGFNLVIS